MYETLSFQLDVSLQLADLEGDGVRSWADGGCARHHRLVRVTSPISDLLLHHVAVVFHTADPLTAQRSTRREIHLNLGHICFRGEITEGHGNRALLHRESERKPLFLSLAVLAGRRSVTTKDHRPGLDPIWQVRPSNANVKSIQV